MTVEDGTGLSGSNSYVSLSFANSYFSERGTTAWAELSDSAKEVLLVKASEFVDCSFRWRGRKATAAQAMQFPRAGLIDDDGYEIEGVPGRLMQAVCECADIMRTDGSLYTTESENGAVVSETVGQLHVSYDASRKPRGCTRYAAVNLKVSGLYQRQGSIVCGGIERV